MNRAHGMQRIVLLAVAFLCGCSEREHPSDTSHPVARFTATVKWIEPIGGRAATVVPIGVDPRWLVAVEVLSAEKVTESFPKKGGVILAIHSPINVFQTPAEELSGRSYVLEVDGYEHEGVWRYVRARAVATDDPTGIL